MVVFKNRHHESLHAIDMPGLLAEHLKATKVSDIRESLRSGRTIRRGQGYSVRVTAPLVLHQAALKQCVALAADGGTRAGRKAYRTYAGRIAAEHEDAARVGASTTSLGGRSAMAVDSAWLPPGVAGQGR
ncbi:MULTISPECIES: hypothetical protein [unclassified Streptomyces]|uniref:hypothetical protein n=1 Tax=unclassified Streptomyces TaxID=2593676 RepID=UPI002DD97DA3|nr:MULTISPECIES: hypothetical protein [unclassified Streptomyces]WSA97800.1 hypothetical protein OIE63_39475 [Streptomyces sp. NBC_01795]WSB82219.1 hypothetical protein OHB04_41340 [Streptomyces sp. NBC_01775]WSS18189.1 hypothetical protein OG533_40420 [Streptomyces sp. NBC_01186]WSS47108.1 hypothetical protein OG220_40725 [Streptomyces sp. NBC_01187]